MPPNGLMSDGGDPELLGERRAASASELALRRSSAAAARAAEADPSAARSRARRAIHEAPVGDADAVDAPGRRSPPRARADASPTRRGRGPARSRHRSEEPPLRLVLRPSPPRRSATRSSSRRSPPHGARARGSERRLRLRRTSATSRDVALTRGERCVDDGCACSDDRPRTSGTCRARRRRPRRRSSTR